MMNIYLKENKEKLTILVLLVIVAITCLYFFQQKIWFHDDEFYTFATANNSNPLTARIRQFNQWLPASYFENYLQVAPGARFRFDAVLENLTSDAHPPLYYLLIHMFSSLFIQIDITYIGLGINAILHLINTYILYKLLRKTIPIPLASLAALLWSLSPGALSSLVLIRMYELMTTFVLLACHAFLSICRHPNKPNYLFIGQLSLLLGMVTHYYYYIFAACLTAWTCLYLLFNKAIKTGMKLGLATLASLATSMVINPHFFHHVLFSQRGQESLDLLSQGQLLTNIRYYLADIQNQLLAGLPLWLFFLFILVGLAAMLVYRHHHHIQLGWLILQISALTAATYLLIIQFISPLVNDRYIAPIYPLIILCLAQLINGLTSTSQFQLQNYKFKTLVILVFGVALIGLNFKNGQVANLYPEYQAVITQLKQKKGQQALVAIHKDYQATKLIFELQSYQSVFISDQANAITQAGQALSQPYVVYMFQGLNQKDLIKTLPHQNSRRLYQAKDYTAIEIFP